jgi:hypothetical protein
MTVTEGKKFRRVSNLESGQVKEPNYVKDFEETRANLKSRFPLYYERAMRNGEGKNIIPYTADGKDMRTDGKGASMRLDTFDPKYSQCKAPVKDSNGEYTERCDFDINDILADKELLKKWDDKRLEAVRRDEVRADLSLKQFIMQEHGKNNHMEWWFAEANMFWPNEEIFVEDKSGKRHRKPPAYTTVIFPPWKEVY